MSLHPPELESRQSRTDEFDLEGFHPELVREAPPLAAVDPQPFRLVQGLPGPRVPALFFFRPVPAGRVAGVLRVAKILLFAVAAGFRFTARKGAVKRDPVATRKTIGPDEIHAAIARMTEAIVTRHGPAAKLMLLGIANGGVTLARRLADRLNLPRTGTLDISFHRDDIGRYPIPKEFSPTVLPGDVNGATVILVDDVLFSGRTVKAALDELFDHGRPATVELAVLVDRGDRRLPVAANYTGLTLPAAADKKVVVVIDGHDPGNDRIEVTAKPKR